MQQLSSIKSGGVSGGAMVLGKTSGAMRPTIWILVRHGPTALAAGAEGDFWAFFLSSINFLFFLPHSRRRPDMD